MAKIPQYQQDRLAQLAVGVPQMDNSGQTIAQNILQNTGAIQNTVEGAQIRTIQAQQEELKQSFHSLGFATSVLQARQDAIVDAHQKITDNIKANTLVDRYSLDLAKRVNDILSDGTIDPSKLPDEYSKITTQLPDSYKETYPNITAEAWDKATIGMNNLNTKYQEQIMTASRTLGNQQTISDWETTQTQKVNAIQGVQGYVNALSEIASPEGHQAWQEVYGPHTSDKIEEFKQNAANQLLTLTSAQGTPALEALKKSGILQNVPAAKWQSAESTALNKTNALTTIAANQVKIGEAKDTMNTSSWRLTDPNDPNRMDTLNNAYVQNKAVAETQLNLPDFKKGDPIIDSQGNPIQYRSPKLYNAAVEEQQSIQSAIKAEEISSIAQQEEAIKGQTKPFIQRYEQAVIEQNQLRSSPEAQKVSAELRAQIQSLKADFNNQGLLSKDAAGNQLKTIDVNQQYVNTIGNFLKASKAGYLDRKEMSGMQELFQLTHDRLAGKLKGKQFAVDSENALHNALNPPTSLSDYVLSLVSGSPSDFKRELSGKLLDARDKFKDINKGLEPSTAQIDHWSQILQKRMSERDLGLTKLKQNAKKIFPLSGKVSKDGLVPPSPPSPPSSNTLANMDAHNIQTMNFDDPIIQQAFKNRGLKIVPNNE